VLAEFTFTVQVGATNQHRWPIVLSQGELSTGYDLFGPSGSESVFVGRNAFAPEFNAAPERTEEGISLSFATEVGLRYRIEFSENLTTWTLLTTLSSTGATLSYTDPIAEQASRRFYRAVQVD
jgi:hypothetical protein